MFDEEMTKLLSEEQVRNAMTLNISPGDTVCFPVPSNTWSEDMLSRYHKYISIMLTEKCGFQYQALILVPGIDRIQILRKV